MPRALRADRLSRRSSLNPSRLSTGTPNTTPDTGELAGPTAPRLRRLALDRSSTSSTAARPAPVPAPSSRPRLRPPTPLRSRLVSSELRPQDSDPVRRRPSR